MHFNIQLTEQEQRQAFNQLVAIQLKGLGIVRGIAGLFLLFAVYASRPGTPQLFAWLRAVAANPFSWMFTALLVALLPPVLYPMLYRQARRSGGVKHRPEGLTALVNEAGVVYFQNGKRTATYTYYAATGVRRGKEFLFLMQKNGYLAALPYRVFQSPEQINATEAMMQNGVAAAKANLAPRLNNQPEACLWRFAYPFDAVTANQAVDAMNQRPGRKFARVLVTILACVLGFALFALLIAWDVKTGGRTGQVGATWIGVTAALYFAGRRGNRAQVKNLADYIYGPFTLEIGEGGVRVFNPQYEAYFGWDEVTGIKRGRQAALLLRGKGLIAALPLHVAPPEAIDEALAFVARKAL